MAEEFVYCVPTISLPEPSSEVLPLPLTLYETLARTGEFRLRAEVEEDERYRQIIPYALIEQGDNFLLVERLKAGSEARLHRLMSLGIGGHINPEDTLAGAGNARDPIEAGLNRELREELSLGAFFAEAVGLIHGDETPVERVHTGILYRVRSPGEIRIRETTKLAGQFVPFAKVARHYERLEGWSQRAFRFLKEQKREPELP